LKSRKRIPDQSDAQSLAPLSSLISKDGLESNITKMCQREIDIHKKNSAETEIERLKRLE
jgi:hypothetical protein